MSKISFDGQVAIITGAGSGIGRAIAFSLAERGAKVVVNNRTLSRAEDVVKEITNAGGSAIADGMLIGAPNAGRTIVDKAMKAFGRIDILVNNAGVACRGPFAEERRRVSRRPVQPRRLGADRRLRPSGPLRRGLRTGLQDTSAPGDGAT